MKRYTLELGETHAMFRIEIDGHAKEARFEGNALEWPDEFVKDVFETSSKRLEWQLANAK